MRTKIASFVLAFIFLFLALGILNLQVIQNKRFRQLSNNNSIRLLPQAGSRGRILDRNGNVIVDNSLSYDVMILPQPGSRIDEILTTVADILDTDSKELKKVFESDQGAPFLPIRLAENIDVKQAMALEELKPELGGIIIQPHPQRKYPHNRLACHVLGYLNEIDHWRLTKLADYGYKTKDIVGFGGIEEKYDYYLRQEEGGLSVEVDHRGRLVRQLGYKPPRSGKDIQLTLDLKIQKIVENNLNNRKGSVIIMDPASGAILALANYPNFNPSVFIKRKNSQIVGLFNDSSAPLINRAISGVYPPGSVFKLILATAALQTGKIKSSTRFFCPGTILIGKKEFSCWNTHNKQNLHDAIAHSCNIFFYRTGILLGAPLIHSYALKFDLSRKTSVDLPYEASGFVPNPLWKRIYKFQSWYDGDTANLSIGQGELLVTPLQMTRMMAVFANKGAQVSPYIVKALDGRDISALKRKITRMPIKISTIEYIREALKSVVTDTAGTANVLSGLPFSIAGKTGTSQVKRGQPHGWFVGFFPFSDPKFVICVLLEHGRSGRFSSVLTKQIIEEMIKEGLI